MICYILLTQLQLLLLITNTMSTSDNLFDTAETAYTAPVDIIGGVSLAIDSNNKPHLAASRDTSWHFG